MKKICTVLTISLIVLFSAGCEKILNSGNKWVSELPQKTAEQITYEIISRHTSDPFFDSESKYRSGLKVVFDKRYPDEKEPFISFTVTFEGIGKNDDLIYDAKRAAFLNKDSDGYYVKYDGKILR